MATLTSITLTMKLIAELRQQAMSYAEKDGEPEMARLLISAAIAIECLAGLSKPVTIEQESFIP